jgi:hypothetical protein
MKSTNRRAATSGVWNEKEARKVLAAWRASGETLAAFARSRGLVPQRLAWWRKRLALPVRDEVPGVVSPPAFVPVTVRAADREAAAVVEIAEGVRVELRTLDDASATWLATVLRCVRGGA